MAMRIEDYALIGDCETSALVGLNGSIDWLCWPRFDSPACFAALLGTKDNGRWLISPRDGSAKAKRIYQKSTLILETLFETATGAVRLIDFMPLRDGCSNIIRIVTGERGTVLCIPNLSCDSAMDPLFHGSRTWKMEHSAPSPGQTRSRFVHPFT